MSELLEVVNWLEAWVDGAGHHVTLDQVNAKILKYERLSKQYQDEKMQAVINYTSEHDRNLRLIETLKDVSQRLELAERKLASLGNPRPELTKSPPPEDVEGIIEQTDAKTGLVTISIGSDHGVNVGNTLEVFRVKPEPKYLGTIRILDAQHHKAVARLTAPPRYGPLKEGDIVASKIMSIKR